MEARNGWRRTRRPRRRPPAPARPGSARLALARLQRRGGPTRVAGRSATSGIPVVLLSADATSGSRERLLAQGARAYLTKPFSIPRLARTTRRHPTCPGRRRTLGRRDGTRRRSSRAIPINTARKLLPTASPRGVILFEVFVSLFRDASQHSGEVGSSHEGGTEPRNALPAAGSLVPALVNIPPY